MNNTLTPNNYHNTAPLLLLSISTRESSIPDKKKHDVIRSATCTLSRFVLGDMGYIQTSNYGIRNQIELKAKGDKNYTLTTTNN